MKPKIITDKNNTFFTSNKIQIGSAVPTSGTYKAGDIIISSAQTNGAFGWICVTAGTPGTWELLERNPFLNRVGRLSDLMTVEKNNIIIAINELYDKVLRGGVDIGGSGSSPGEDPDTPGEDPDTPGEDLGPANVWVQLDSLPYGRDCLSVEIKDDVLYLIGGNIPLNDFDYVYRNGVSKYDLKTKTLTEGWTDISYGNYQIDNPPTVLIENNIYMLGAQLSTIDTGVYTTVVINLLTGTTTNKGSYLSGDTYGFQPVNYNGEIYCVGGCNGSSVPSDYNMSYNINTDTWTYYTDCPIGDSRFVGAALYNNIIYTFPGYYTNIYAYDILTDSWSTKSAELPSSVYFLRAHTIDDYIYIISGDFSNSYKYDPINDTITAFEQMPTIRTEDFGSCVDENGKLYVVAGYNPSVGSTSDDRMLPAIEYYRPVFNSPDNGGSETIGPGLCTVLSATMTTPRTDLVAEYYNGNIYIFSGEYNLGFYTSPFVSRYEVATNKYVDQHTTMYGYGTDESYNSFLRVGALSTIVGNTVYITGGYSDVQNIENTKSKDVMQYNIDSNSWAMGTESNYHFIDTQLAKINNMLYAVGGTYDSMDGSFGGYGQFYDTVSDTWTDITQNTRIGTNTAVAADHEHNMIYTLSIQLFYGYDVSTSTWTSGALASLPYTSQFARALYHNGGVYVVGGHDSTIVTAGTNNEVCRYDITTGSWTQKSTLKQAVSKFGLAYDPENGVMYIVGGEYDRGAGDTIYNKIQKYEL